MTTPWLLALLALAVLLLAGCSSLRGRAATPELLNGQWRSDDGKVMPFTTWGPEKPRAVVIAVHGLSGAASDFWLAGERLARHGCRLYACDLRGQGHEPVEKEKGHIASTKRWQRDLEIFSRLTRERHPDAPQFWMGESLGSLIVLHTADSGAGRVQPAGVILSSPVAGLRQPVPGGKRWLLEMASLLAPRKRLRLGELAGVDESQIQVTNHTNHADQMAVTPHHVSAFSTRLLAGTGRWVDRVSDAARRVRLPALVLASPNDVVSSPAQIEALFAQLGSTDKTLRWYERSHHLLLHDVEREQVAADLLDWIERRLDHPRS